ncbi:hypothetical protein [Dolichospermum circinale]|uniref:hypothetical protein n=1 Tax=Dolichospermum circinale TaxID=109265 RepID=UPI00232DD364|nr:hypothetical protein [Dolichospermum circinale]MDB9466290.1 hypothetical protein [Dolichospermum circinale CS-539/09]MDB9469905.1 hypothetical protein [Dolichospermum circinale CS-539]
MTNPNNYSQWDFLFISAVALFGITFKYSLNIPNKMSNTLNRIFYRGIIDNEDDAKTIISKLEAKANNWSNIAGFILGTLVFLGWMIGLDFNAWNIFLIIFETYLAYVTGCIFGTMAAYGTLGYFFAKTGQYKIALNLIPDCIDGASGLKPIGDFYFFQAIIASIPAFFISIWWLIISLLSKLGYFIPVQTLEWKEKAILLLPLAVLFEVLVFILPMYKFHVIMSEFKTELLNKSDRAIQQITDMKLQLLKIQKEEEFNLVESKISELNERYRIYDRMNTWPVSLKTKELFAVNNLFLIMPVLFKHSGDIAKLIDTIKKM